MEYKPKRTGKNAKKLMIFFALISVIGIVMSGVGVGVNSLNQLIIIGFLTAAVFVAIRYLLTDFVYKTDEGGYLEIIKIGSKIPQTLASVKISRNDMIVPVKEDMSEYKVERKAVFTVNLKPSESYWYIFTVNGQRQALVIECDKGYVEYLTRLISSANGADGGEE